MKVTQPIHEEPANSKPVTLVEGRTLKPGHENDFYAWVQRAIAASERFPGNPGVTILTLGKGRSQARYVIHRLADEAAERAWIQSEERDKLVQEAAVSSTPHTQTSSGLVAWFTFHDP